MTLADLKASEIPVATIKEKLDEFEAAATAKSATRSSTRRRRRVIVCMRVCAGA